jgi:hypothetical protein
MIDIQILHPMNIKEYIELVTDQEIDDEVWIDHCLDYEKEFIDEYFKDMYRICYTPVRGLDY